MLKTCSCLAFIVATLLSSSCQEDEDSINPLLGTWLESTDRSDTLIFEEEFFILNRGKEMQNGNLLPIPDSGLYFYELRKDTVSVQNSVSSFSGFYNVPIEVEGDRLTIGDFYQKDTINSSLLFFERIE